MDKSQASEALLLGLKFLDPFAVMEAMESGANHNVVRMIGFDDALEMAVYHGTIWARNADGEAMFRELDGNGLDFHERFWGTIDVLLEAGIDPHPTIERLRTEGAPDLADLIESLWEEGILRESVEKTSKSGKARRV